MRKLILLAAQCLPLAVLAQSTFIITGIGKAFNNGDKIYLTYKIEDKVIADSATVANNTFKIKGTIYGKAQGTLYKNENPLTAEIVHDDAHLYIEAGHIVVASQDSLIHAVIGGTPENEDLMQLNAALKPLQHKLLNANITFETLTPEQQNDINTVADFRKKVQAINEEMLPLQFAFIKSHPASYVSLVTLKALLRNTAIIQQVADGYAGLTPAVKQTPLGKNLGLAITAAIKSAVGQTAIDFMQPDTLGRAVKLSDFKGKYVLIDFWASWCGPCRAENPFIVAAFNKYKDKNFTVLGISLDDQSTKHDWLKAIQKDGLAWQQVSDLKGWDNTVSALYGIKSIPANILVGPTGKIIAKNIKDKTLDNTLANLLTPVTQ